MKVGVLPDLHLGITKPQEVKNIIARLAKTDLSLLVLAGDIGEPLKQFCEALDMFSGLDIEICVLAGNHDLWTTGTNSSQDLWERLLPAETRRRGFIWLEDEVLIWDSLAVIGSLAWYDYSGRPDELRNKSDQAFFDTKGSYVKDGQFVNLPWDDIQFSSILRANFIQRIEQAQSDPKVNDILICTHVPIFREQRVDTPRWNNRVNTYYANFTLGKTVEQYNKVRWAIAGHTHSPVRGCHTCPDGRLIYCSVVGSDYNYPDFEIVETGNIEKIL